MYKILAYDLTDAAIEKQSLPDARRGFHEDMSMKGSRREWATEQDAALTKIYQEKYRNGALKALAIDFDIPANTLSYHAKAIGLPRIRGLRRQRRHWVAAEDQIIVEFGDFPIGTIRAKLAAIGFDRAPSSIRGRRQCLRNAGVIISSDRDEMTIVEVAQGLGCKESAIYRWIQYGWLRAQTMRQNLKTQNYYITRADLRQFCRTHTAALQRCGRPDLIWYTDLIANP